MRRSYAVWRAFWSDRRAAVAAVFLLVEIALVLFLPLFLGQDPNLTDRSAGFWAAPSAQHWLGTDDVGRDLFARLLYGGRTSLLVGFASAALGVVLGVPLGLLAGYKGGAWEYWIMRACDTFQSFPSIILVLAMVSLLGPSVWNIIWVIGGLGWASVARLVYSGTLSTKQTGYVEASAPWARRTGDLVPDASAQRHRPGVGGSAAEGGAGHSVGIQPELSGRGPAHAPGLLGQPDPERHGAGHADHPALGLGPAGAVHRGHGLGPAAGGGGVTKSLESPQTLTEGHDCLFLPAGVE